MKMLPQAEAVTGEVSCGRSKHPSGVRSDSWCCKPANHDGWCHFVVLPYSMDDSWTLEPSEYILNVDWADPNKPDYTVHSIVWGIENDIAP